MKALFLAGGAGTRLWPLSRIRRPKQILSLIGNKSLIVQTVDRVSEVISPKDVWIVTGEELKEHIAEQCPQIPTDQLITEPFPLGTNLAVGLGLIHLAAEDPDTMVLLGWVDSYVGDHSAFNVALRKAEQMISKVKAVEGVIFGVSPTYPATGFGYIEAGTSAMNGIDDLLPVVRFEEKPSRDRAEEFVRSGRHFWNPGFSVWKVSKLLDLMRVHIPEHFDALQKVAPFIGTESEHHYIRENFQGLQPIAIDHAIFEKAAGLAMIAVSMDWADIGSWKALFDVRSKGDAVVTTGEVITLDTKNCLIHSDGRLIATIGISDLIVVATTDAVLVAHKDDSDRVKELQDELRKIGGNKYL